MLFLDGLPGRNGRKFDVLVNSHHHGDHTGGNGWFKPETKTAAPGPQNRLPLNLGVAYDELTGKAT